MIITCSNCNTSFNLNDSLVKDTGSKVRCSKCKYVFRAFPPHVAKKPQIEKAAKTSATDRKSEDGVDAEKTPTQVFPTSDDRRQGDKKTDSPPAAAQLVPDKGTPLSFPDASINQMDGKNESFDLSELDVFFDEKDKQSDKESAKEDVFLKPDSEPGTPEPVSTASDDIDFSELDNFFGDDKIDSDPFADPFDSETFPESRTAPPETEDRENLQNIATDGNAERLTDIEEIEEIDDVEEIDEVEEIEDFDELDEPNKPGDSDGSNLESIFNEALDKESEIAIAGGESESLSESDFEGNLKNIQSILENEEDINLDDLSGDNENEIRFDIDAAENEIGQASSGKPTDTEEFGELDLSDLDELFGAEKDEDRGERVGPEPTIDIENELDEAVGKKAEDRDDEVDLAEIEGFFAEEFPPVQDNDGKVAESEETGEDMDFDLDLQTDDKPSAEDKTEDLGLGDDIDFDLDFELDDEKPSRAKPEGTAGGDLGLEPKVEDKPTAKPKAEEIGLENDIDFEPDDAKPSGAKPEGKAGDDDLDFDLDFELDDEKPSRAKPEGKAGGDLGLEPEIEDKPTAEAKADDLGLDDDIDFDFELDDAKPSRAKPEGKAGGDFGLEPEIEDKPTAEAKADDLGLDDDIDFDFNFELDDAKPSRAKPEGKAGGDFGLELELEDKPTAEAKADDLGLDDDIDFDFDLEPDDAKPLGAKPDGKAGNDDLDFDLEMESDEVSANEKAAKSAGKRPPAKSEDDFEFDFEDDGNLEKVESQEEFDLSDLDNMVDLKEQDRTKSAGDGDDLELDFDLQLEADDGTGEPPKVNLEGEEFEFEEFGDSKEVSVERADGNDDFQVNLAMGETSDNISTREQDDYHLEEDEEKLQKIFDTITLTGKPEIDDMEVEPEKSAPSKSKKKLGKPIILVLVLALIGAGGYFGFGFVKDMGIGIPFIGSEPPPPPDPGNLNIIAFDLDSKFVENQTAGKLFAITGKVKNEYPEPRSFIKISGKLYQPGKKMIQTQTVSAGNVISEMELGALDAESIKKRLTNRFGQNNMNTDIKTGQAVPFMIVFSNLPDQLEEYTVSVESSTAGKNN